MVYAHLIIQKYLELGKTVSNIKYKQFKQLKTITIMDTIELKFNEKLLNSLKSRIKFVGTGSVRVKDDIIILTYNSNAILKSMIKRKDIAITENNIKVMAKCLMF